MLLNNLLVLFALYLLGSIPFGLIVSILGWDIDLREVGSRNIGMSNVLRTLGVLPALMTLIGDLGKAWLGLTLAQGLLSHQWLEIGAIVLVIGHCWSVFLAFKGGKGVATTGGVLLFFQPLSAILCALLWFVLRFSVFSSSMASFCALLLLLVLTVFTNNDQLVLFLGLSFIVLIRHKENITRILSGNENR